MYGLQPSNDHIKNFKCTILNSQYYEFMPIKLSYYAECHAPLDAECHAPLDTLYLNMQYVYHVFRHLELLSPCLFCHI